MENLYRMVAGFTLVQFLQIINTGRTIKRDVRVHCISSFGTRTGICATIKPEISWI